MFRKIQKLLRSTKGVATSLLEATATIAVGATLAGAAITVVTDKVQQARIAATAQDVQMIGDAINNFEKDNGFYPIFGSAGSPDNLLTGPDPSGTATGATFAGTLTTRKNVDLLESKDGDEPDVVSSASINDHDGAFNNSGHPGHASGFATGTPGWRSGNKSTIESQLSTNGPSYVERGKLFLVGSKSGDPKRGWNGPYMAKIPSTDGWGNKFKINALYLDDHRVSAVNSETNPFMTFVLSAGPNEMIQTLYEVTSKTVGTAIGGDDILFRIK